GMGQFKQVAADQRALIAVATGQLNVTAVSLQSLLRLTRADAEVRERRRVLIFLQLLTTNAARTAEQVHLRQLKVIGLLAGLARA
nr:hypothetical protein [Tanacetum cinerariifolium]